MKGPEVLSLLVSLGLPCSFILSLPLLWGQWKHQQTWIVPVLIQSEKVMLIFSYTLHSQSWCSSNIQSTDSSDCLKDTHYFCHPFSDTQSSIPFSLIHVTCILLPKFLLLFLDVHSENQTFVAFVLVGLRARLSAFFVQVYLYAFLLFSSSIYFTLAQVLLN